MNTRRNFLKSLIAAVALSPVVAKLATKIEAAPNYVGRDSFHKWISDFMLHGSDDKTVLIGPKAYAAITQY